MSTDSPKSDSSASSAQPKHFSNANNGQSKLDSFLSTGAGAPEAPLTAAMDNSSTYGLADPATSVPKISSLVQPKETTIPKQVKASSLVQQGPVQSRRASRIRGSERGA